MTFECIWKVSPNRLREIAAKLAGKIWIVGHVRAKKVFVQGKLGVSQQHRKLRPRERLGSSSSLDNFHVGRQELDGAIKQLALLQHLHQPLLEAEVFKTAAFDEGQRQRLLVVVAQNQGRNLVSHAGQDDITILARQTTVAERNAQSNLDIDLDVGRIDAR